MRYVYGLLFIVWSYFSIKELIENYKLHREGVNQELTIYSMAYVLILMVISFIGIVFITAKYW